MGFMDKLKGSESGRRCHQDETGIIHCQIYDNKKGEKIATGTDVPFIVSPENNCVPIPAGQYDLLEKDEAKINRAIEPYVKACKRGLSG